MEGSYDDSDIILAKNMRADWINFAKNGMPLNANTFNDSKSNARIYDSSIKDKTIDHEEFYKSYSTFWENLQQVIDLDKK